MIGVKANCQEYVLLSDDISEIEDYYRVSPSLGYKNISGIGNIDLKPFCPNVGNQGQTGSCAAFATTYGAMTISHAIKNQINDSQFIQEMRFSPSFVYNQLIDTACEKPLNIIDVVEFLKSNGSCPLNSMKFTEDCSLTPNTKLKELAKEFQIEMAARLFSSKTDNISKVELIKQYLSDSIPVIALIQVYDSFIDSEDKSVWSFDPSYDNYMGGGHAIVVTGFDESKGVFEIMNSWGKNWGNNGFIYIPYTSFGEICMSAMIIDVQDAKFEKQSSKLYLGEPIQKDKTNQKILTPRLSSKKAQTFLKNNFIINKIVRNGSLLLKQPVDVYYDKDRKYYVIYSIRKNDNIQFVSSNLTKGNYIYIISQDPDNTINIHWPLEEEIDNEKVIQKQLISGSLFTIPSEESVMQKTKIGSEWILVLSSRKKLDIKNMILNFERSYPSSKINDLNKFLSEGKVDDNFVNHSDNKIESYVNLSDDEKFIMPILINIK